MRVAVCARAAFGLSASQAGAAVARSFAARGAQVAVVPLGDGDGAADALRELVAPPDAVLAPEGMAETSAGGHSEDPVDQDWLHGSSWRVGQQLAHSLTSDAAQGVRRIYLDAGPARWHDAGAGFLAALGGQVLPRDADLTRGVESLAAVTSVDLKPARGLLAGRELVLLAERDQATAALLGLRGISSLRGRAYDLPLSEQVRLDSLLSKFAAACGAAVPGDSVGAGACGGLGFAVRSLGGRVESGYQACANAAQLGATLRRADLTVVVCDQLDFGTWAQGLVPFVTALAEREGAATPIVVAAGQCFISARELRLHGIDSAYRLDTVASQDQLTRSADQLAATWMR